MNGWSLTFRVRTTNSCSGVSHHIITNYEALKNLVHCLLLQHFFSPGFRDATPHPWPPLVSLLCPMFPLLLNVGGPQNSILGSHSFQFTLTSLVMLSGFLILNVNYAVVTSLTSKFTNTPACLALHLKVQGARHTKSSQTPDISS